LKTLNLLCALTNTNYDSLHKEKLMLLEELKTLKIGKVEQALHYNQNTIEKIKSLEAKLNNRNETIQHMKSIGEDYLKRIVFLEKQ
jgi:hypothetical protein